MVRRRRLLQGALGLLAGWTPWARALAQAGPAEGYACYEIGDLKAPRPRPTEMGLMLHGGGDWSLDAFRWLMAKAGGGHIVVLRASYAGENGVEIFNEVGGVASVRTLVITDRRAAYDGRVLDIVRSADGIFLGGGDQSNYVRDWKGAPLNALLDAHVRAGRPIGGTSAGLAVLGAYCYGALDGGSIDSPTALGDPLGTQVTLVDDFLHLPHLGQVITDSHFQQRNRLGRLVTFVARLAHEQRDPRITGIGVDENTALCIDAEGVGRVMSGHDGHAWLVRPGRQADVIAPHRPLTFAGIPIVGLGRDSRLQLDGFKVTRPAFERVCDVRDGTLSFRT